MTMTLAATSYTSTRAEKHCRVCNGVLYSVVPGEGVVIQHSRSRATYTATGLVLRCLRNIATRQTCGAKILVDVDGHWTPIVE